jgi:hypothetical protein
MSSWVSEEGPVRLRAVLSASAGPPTMLFSSTTFNFGELSQRPAQTSCKLVNLRWPWSLSPKSLRAQFSPGLWKVVHILPGLRREVGDCKSRRLVPYSCRDLHSLATPEQQQYVFLQPTAMVPHCHRLQGLSHHYEAWVDQRGIKPNSMTDDLREALMDVYCPSPNVYACLNKGCWRCNRIESTAVVSSCGGTLVDSNIGRTGL